MLFLVEIKQTAHHARSNAGVQQHRFPACSIGKNAASCLSASDWAEALSSASTLLMKVAVGIR